MTPDHKITLISLYFSIIMILVSAVDLWVYKSIMKRLKRLEKIQSDRMSAC